MKYFSRKTVGAIALFSILAAAACGTRVFAVGTQPTAPTPPAAGSTASVDSSATQQTQDALYQIAPGDVLDINVLGFAELTTEATVTPDGMITVPLLGLQKVSGLTTAQAESMLTTKWSKYVVNPPVTVSIKQKHVQLVSFYGWVTHPGTATFTPNLHLLQGLALVGGALPDGDLRKVTITHHDGTVETVDVSDPAVKGGTAADVVLQEDDNVFVPEDLDKFEVTGSVQNPGSYPFKPGTKLLDALTAAGGVTLQTADLQHASLLHNGVTKTVDLTNLVTKGDQSENIALSPGDAITIPIVQFREYVFGDVSHPGYVDYKPGDRVIDALNNAGLMPDAQLWKVNVIRQDPTKNVARMQVVNVENFLLHGKDSGNPQIKPGDVLYVPEKAKTFQLQDMLGILSGINVLNVGDKILTGTYLTAH